MVTINDKARDALIAVAAILWGFIVFASWEGALAKDHQLIYFGLLACAALVVVYYVMGAAINEKLSFSTLLYPVLLNGITQAVAFTIIYMTKGQKMDFILGMHPGFFGAIVFFWLGNFLTSTLSYVMFFEKGVLPDDKWEEFMKEVAAHQKLH